MVFEKIRDLIVKEFNVSPDAVTMETHFADDLGADSLDAVDLVMSIEDEFNVEVDEDTAQNIRRVKDIVNFVESKIK